MILVFEDYEWEDARQSCCDGNLDSDYGLKRRKDLILSRVLSAKHTDKVVLSKALTEFGLCCFSKVIAGAVLEPHIACCQHHCLADFLAHADFSCQSTILVLFVESITLLFTECAQRKSRLRIPHQIFSEVDCYERNQRKARKQC